MGLLPKKSKSPKATSEEPSVSENDLRRAGTLKTGLRLAALASQALPTQIPKAALEFALELFTGIYLTNNLVKATEDISKSLQSLSDQLKELPSDGDDSDMPPDLSARVVELIAELGDISKKCQKPPRSRLNRFLSREEDAIELQEIAAQMRDAVQRFQLWSSIRQERVINSVDRNVRAVDRQTVAVNDKLHSVNRKLSHMEHDARDDRLRERLRPVAQATYDSSRSDTMATCLPGTRVKVLDEIMAWVKSMSPSTPRVFPLTGMAGTGKTTIAMDIAARTANLGIMGASYFFSRRGANELRDPTKVLPTLVYQLSLISPEFKNAIYKVVEQSPDIADRTLVQQNEVLLKSVLNAAGSRKSPLLIILDAFDECEGTAAKQLLHVLLETVTHLRASPIKLFITGRPEIYIERAFGASSTSAKIALHNIETEVVEGDIRLYLETALAAAPSTLFLDISREWFKREELELLVKRSARLFIYAATTVRYIESDPPAYPRLQLDNILKASSPSSSVFSALNTLYLEVLGKIASSPPETRLPILDLLGSLILMKDALPLRAFDKFLGFNPGSSRSFLGTLAAVLALPPSDDDVVVVYHPSFSDFLIDPTRCNDPRILILPSEHEKRLARHCFLILQAEPLTTPRDMSSLHIAADEISDELRYCALYWTTHLVKSPEADPELMTLLDAFTRTHMLLWLEILSAIQEVRKGAKCLDDVLKWAISSGCPKPMITLLQDGYRFVTAFAKSIEHGPRHVYDSALAWCPKNTSLWRLYNKQLPNTIRVVKAFETHWMPVIGTLEGHTQAIRDVVFSPNGTKVASASYDNTLRIWDPTTGGCIAVLEGHTNTVGTVVFSHDGTMLASGSGDKTVRTWDPTTGGCVATLEGHTGVVYVVAFSPDDTKLASGSGDQTVRIWSTVTGGCINTLKGHTDVVQSVSFSPIAAKLASGSDDSTVMIWNLGTGTCDVVLKGHTDGVNTVAFSSNGERLASGSDDRTVRVWEPATGGCSATLEGHTDTVYTIAFSSDSIRLASGSGDSMVRVWDLTTNSCVATLEGHTDNVYTVVFSPDGEKVASGSVDRTARIWATTACDCTIELDGHTNSIHTVAFSPDGTKLASGSDDRTVRIWSTNTGGCDETQERHTDYVFKIIFSPDGKRLASGSGDTTVRIWDSATGGCVTTLKGHTDTIYGLGFSSDGNKLASGSGDCTVMIWDVVTGDCVATLEDHDNIVNAVAFSPDGMKLASGSADHTVRIWDMTTNDCVETLEGHTDIVESVAWSPDGAKLASGSPNKTVRIWDTVTGNFIIELQDHTDATSAITFSPDGTQLGTPDYGWDVATGTKIVKPAENRVDGQGQDSHYDLRAHLPNNVIRFAKATLYDDSDLQVTSPSGEVFSVCHVPRNLEGFSAPTICGDSIAFGCYTGRVVILDLKDWTPGAPIGTGETVLPTQTDPIED